MKKLFLSLSAFVFSTSAFAAVAGNTLCYDRLSIADRTVSTNREDVCLKVNRERASRSYAELELDPALSRVAQRYAQEMANGNFFDHVSPSGQTFRQRLVRDQVSYRRAGENIARGQDTPTVVVQQWMESPGHRRNILTPGFRKIGVGRVKNYWVQVFTD